MKIVDLKQPGGAIAYLKGGGGYLTRDDVVLWIMIKQEQERGYCSSCVIEANLELRGTYFWKCLCLELLNLAEQGESVESVGETMDLRV